MIVPNLSPESTLPEIHQPLPFSRDQPGITRKASKQGTGKLRYMVITCLQAHLHWFLGQ